jgi:hypothetical protein
MERKPVTKKPSVKEENKIIPERVNPNAELQLERFDYGELQGESFKEYKELIASMKMQQHYDFEQYMTSGIFEKEFDKKTGQVYDDLVGIRINNTKPVNTTRIPLRIAIELNMQIFNKDNPATNSRYYLLKK